MSDAENQAIWEALSQVLDPEIGLNIVDLGLVYSVDKEASGIRVTMTLTSAGCPMGDQIVAEAEQSVAQVAEGLPVQVALVWEPFWTPDRMSEKARQVLGW